MENKNRKQYTIEEKIAYYEARVDHYLARNSKTLTFEELKDLTYCCNQLDKLSSIKWFLDRKKPQ